MDNVYIISNNVARFTTLSPPFKMPPKRLLSLVRSDFPFHIKSKYLEVSFLNFECVIFCQAGITFINFERASTLII